MTLHILGIDADPPTQRFWTSAGDLLSSLVSVQPTYAQAIHAVIAEGGDVEITAHNEPDRITVTLVEVIRPEVRRVRQQRAGRRASKGRVNQTQAHLVPPSGFGLPVVNHAKRWPSRAG